MCVWYRVIDSDLNITTNILSLQKLDHHCKAQDIFKSCNDVFERFYLKIVNCISITTDSAANLTGIN